MSRLMRLAEVLRDIAEERSKSEIEQALDLCTGFADRVSKEPVEAPEYSESLWETIAAECSTLPN